MSRLKSRSSQTSSSQSRSPQSRSSQESQTPQPPLTGVSTGASPVVDEKSHRAITIVSGILLVIITCALIVGAWLPLPTRVGTFLRGSSSATTPVREVASTSRQLYCPRSLGLSDSEAYGDSSYTATTGNLTSARTILAFGSTYEGSVSAPASDPQPQSQTLSLPSGSTVGVTRSEAKQAVIAQSQQLTASRGDGLVGSMASWASTGDVRGSAASTCVAASSSADFLLPSTAVGHSARLLVSNDSDKATTIAVRSWGSDKAGEIHPAANSQISVAAQASSSINLGALTGHHNAVFVHVRSTCVAVHFLVETSAEKGLTPKGVDFAHSLTASTRATMTGLADGASARLLLFSHSDTHVEGNWLSDEGRADARKLSEGVRLSADQVSVVDLGKVPEQVRAVHLSADHPVFAQIVQTVNGTSGQQDYSFVSPQIGSQQSAFALPNGLSATVVGANASSSAVTAHIAGISADGVRGEEKTVRIAAQSTSALRISKLDVDNCAGVTVRVEKEANADSSQSARDSQDVKDVIFAADLQSAQLASASVAQSAVEPFTSLMPLTSRVLTVRSPLAAAGKQN